MLLLLAFQVPVQQNEVFEQLLSKLSIYALRESPEKIYLHTDKEAYQAGETIWFKAYLLDGISHRPSTKSKVIYVELLDEEDRVVEDRKLFIDDNSGAADLIIDKNLKQGNYRLRAFTKYMLNDETPLFFQKQLPVRGYSFTTSEFSENTKDSSATNIAAVEAKKTTALSPEVMVDFFPEGGNLIAGITNTVGIKITDKQGAGIQLKGTITDEEGNTLTNFNSLDYGLGSFRFTPETSKTYFATTLIDGLERKFAIPKALKDGYVLSVTNNRDHLILEVMTNEPNSLVGTLLLGHLRGQLFYKHIAKADEKQRYALKLPTKGIKDGVAQFTLFTANGEPVCERLVFIDHPDNDAKLEVSLNKKSFSQREKVSAELKLKDRKGNQLDGNFSIGVSRIANPSKETMVPSSIKSWLLLDSDLGSTVENPNYFFEDNSLERKKLLDLLMLTHGWRRFVWTDFLKTRVSKSQAFPPEKGLMITGKTTALDNLYSSKNASITLGLLGQEPYYDTKTTRGDGRFSFGPFAFNDSINVVLDATDPNKKGKASAKDISIVVDAQLPKLPSAEKKEANWSRNNQIPQKTALIYPEEFDYSPDVVQLDEAVVTEKKKTMAEKITEELNSLTPYGRSSNRIIRDSVLGQRTYSLMDLLIMAPGVQVKGNYPTQILKIRGGLHSIELSTEPLILVDNIPVPFEVIQQMDTFGVLFVDVLLGAEAAYYGVRGANGVIAIYTDRGKRYNFAQERYPGITNFVMPGFYKTREFYAPNYAIKKPEHSKTDYRNTLHWEPALAVKNASHKPLTFFTDDSSGSYLMRIEGVTSDGRLVSQTTTFHID